MTKDAHFKAFVLPAVGLIVITFVAYMPAVRCGFIWDDNDWVTQNPLLRNLEGLRKIWTQPHSVMQYYPLVYTSWWLDYHLWRLNPVGYHLENIWLHCLAAAVLWRLLKFLRIPGAWAAAAVFALHPVNVESVAWVTERKNVLSGLFYFSAAFAYLRYAFVSKSENTHGDSTIFYFLSLVLFLCALLSKTATCTLPAVLLLVIWWKQGKVTLKDIFTLAPFFIVGAGFGLLTAYLEQTRHIAAGHGTWGLSFIERFILAGRALCFYTTKLFWPARLTFIYPRWVIDSGSWRQYVYPAVVILVVVSAWILRGRFGRSYFTAVGCFIVTLFPATGFFNVYFMRYSYVQDHFQYLAGSFLIILAVGLGCRAAARLGKKAASVKIATASVLLLALGALTHSQCYIYENEKTLWRDTLKKNPESFIAHNNLGLLFQADGDFDIAYRHFNRALQLKPDYVEAHNNLAGMLQLQTKYDEAISHYRRALRLRPASVDVHNNLGVALASQGKIEQAIEHYQMALQQRPQFVPAHINLARALYATGRGDEAVKHFKTALKYEPANLQALCGVAEILLLKAEQNPDGAKEAVGFAELAAGLTEYNEPMILKLLADCYAAAGKFGEAVTTAEKALELARLTGKNALADDIRERLKRYKRP